MTWILFIFALIAGFIAANAFADFSVGILQCVADDWDTTMYTNDLCYMVRETLAEVMGMLEAME